MVPSVCTNPEDCTAALAALGGSLVNLPVSYLLTRRIGVAGVIWGTVLTTLFSNLLVPGVYCFRVLGVRPWAFLRRTLSAPMAGAAGLLAAAWAFHLVVSPEPAGGGGARHCRLAGDLVRCGPGIRRRPGGRGPLLGIAGAPAQPARCRLL